MTKLELLKFDKYIGIYNPKKDKRLENLYPKKSILVRARATAYEGGYAHYYSTDLHQKLRRQKIITMLEYKRLLKKYKQV